MQGVRKKGVELRLINTSNDDNDNDKDDSAQRVGLARKTGHPKHQPLVTSALRCHACTWRSVPRAAMAGVSSKADVLTDSFNALVNCS